MRKPRGAFSLFEVVLVGVVVVILSSLAYPYLSSMITKDGLAGKRGQMAALDELRNKLAQARSRAMDEGRAYRVAFVPERGNYRIAPDSDEFWGNGGSGTSDSSAAKPLVVAGSLPQGCYFCEAVGVSGPASEGETSMASEQVDPSSYQNLVTFLPNGNARDDGQVVLQTVGARPVIVRLKGSTSVVTTEEG